VKDRRSIGTPIGTEEVLVICRVAVQHLSNLGPRSKVLLTFEFLDYNIMDATRNDMSIVTSCHSVYINLLEVLQDPFEGRSVELSDPPGTIKPAYRLWEIVQQYLLLQRHAKSRYYHQRSEASIASCYGVHSLAESQVKIDPTVGFLIAYNA